MNWQYTISLLLAVLPTLLAFWIAKSLFAIWIEISGGNFILQIAYQGMLFVITFPFAIVFCKIFGKLLFLFGLITANQKDKYPFHKTQKLK